MLIKVLSRDEVESDYYLAIKESSMAHIILSTSSENLRKGPVKVKENPFCKGIVRFSFDDLDTRHIEIVKQKEGLCKYPMRLFTAEDAKEILAFVNSNINDIEAIISHCDAGISRSAAMAAAMSKIINNKDDFFFENYLPNMLVYTTLLNEYFYNLKVYRNIEEYYYKHLPPYKDDEDEE